MVACNFHVELTGFNSNMVRLKEDGQAVHTLLQLGFNSNMVRLKAFEARELGYVISCFNSNMVRLKERIRRNHRKCNRCFNSNMVRLKVLLSIIINQYILTFQFQYGSIKSARLLFDCCLFVVFQFQYGSIKSSAVRKCRVRNPRFNSNMVRLKGERFLWRCKVSICFNSNMVRLKVVPKSFGRGKETYVSIPIWFD